MTPALLALEAAGIEYSVHVYQRGSGLGDFGREAAHALGLDEAQVFKTLMVVADDDIAVAVVPVSCQLSMKLFASVVGAKRAALSDRVRAERSTGYIVGGISPFGQRKQVRTVVDETAELYDLVYVSGGKRGMDIAVAPADLIRLLEAIVAPITA